MGPEPEKTEGLRFGPVGPNWVHLCVDMQRMFAEPTDWHTPWVTRVLPNVLAVVELDPARTVFTRFITASSPDSVGGTWRRYFRRWENMTRDRIDPSLLELVPELGRFVPPATVEDKPVMSPWHGPLHQRLQSARVSTLLVTGAETEVCVLATVMGAIDLGYRVIIVVDAVCSGADSTHEAVLEIYGSRFGMQVETVSAAELVAARIDDFLG